MLGPESQLLPQLIEWVSGPRSSLPTRQITENMVDIIQLCVISKEMFPVLQHLRQQGVLSSGGCLHLQQAHPELCGMYSSTMHTACNLTLLLVLYSVSKSLGFI